MSTPSGITASFRRKTMRAYEGNMDGSEPKLSE
jgi:hypothetical protein